MNTMNDKQLKVLLGLVVTIVLMGLYPPFHMVGREGASINRGYSWIWAPPDEIAKVDTGMLLVQWIGVCLIGRLLYLALSRIPRAAHVNSGSGQQPSIPKGNPILRLWHGDAGLVRSYWGYGVAAGVIWSLILAFHNPAPGSSTAKLFVACMAIYFAVVYVGIWRAAGKYQGNKAWAQLAKFAVVLGALVTVLPAVAMLS